METLNCTHCQKIKPISDFHKSVKEKRGYRYNCKSCSSQKYKNYLITVDGALEKRRERDKKAKQVQRDRVKITPPYEKKCYCCGELKKIVEFIKDKTTVTGVSTTCKGCKSKKLNFYHGSFSDTKKEEYRLRNLRYNLKYNYNITLEDYNLLLEAQNGLCVICNQPPIKGNGDRLHVDHCHKTKKVRGLLCSPCNQGLGLFQDSYEILLTASNYLKIAT